LVIRLRACASFTGKTASTPPKNIQQKGAGSIRCGALCGFDIRRIRGKF
jgi:hypothetical protein